MENEFSGVMAKRSKSELIAIVTTDRAKYQPLAIEAAEAEIQKRGIETQEFETLAQKNEAEVKKTAEFEAKNVGSGIRFVHFLIDSMAIIALYFIVSFLAFFILPTTSYYSELALCILTYLGYYIALEGKYQKTLGKMATKTKVVDANGNAPFIQDIVVRTFCRFIPFDRLSFLFTPSGFHDRISKTTVIKDN